MHNRKMESRSQSGGFTRVEDTRTYQAAYAVAMKIFHLSKRWPRDERFALTSQVRDASRSVCANMSEAWAKRRYPAHFVSKLSDADGEAAETRTWLKFARDCGYLDSQVCELLTAMDRVSGALVKMMVSPEKWCGPLLLRESPVVYGSKPDEIEEEF